MYFPFIVGVLCLFLFCYVLLCVHSSFAIILKRKRKLVALLLLSYRCVVYVNVLWLFLTVLWVGMQCVIVVFSDFTHLPLCGISQYIHYKYFKCSTEDTVIPLSKKGEFTVFLSKELLEFSKENKLYTVAWQNKAEKSHRDGM